MKENEASSYIFQFVFGLKVNTMNYMSEDTDLPGGIPSINACGRFNGLYLCGGHFLCKFMSWDTATGGEFAYEFQVS